MSQLLDFTDFMWMARLNKRHELCIVVYCPAHRASRFKIVLQREMICAVVRSCSIEIHSPLSMARWVELVDDRPEVVHAFRTYASICAGGGLGRRGRGVRVSSGAARTRTEAAQAAYALAGPPQVPMNVPCQAEKGP